jgi:hypothetical protein
MNKFLIKTVKRTLSPFPRRDNVVSRRKFWVEKGLNVTMTTGQPFIEVQKAVVEQDSLHQRRHHQSKRVENHYSLPICQILRDLFGLDVLIIDFDAQPGQRFDAVCLETQLRGVFYAGQAAERHFGPVFDDYRFDGRSVRMNLQEKSYILLCA